MIKKFALTLLFSLVILSLHSFAQSQAPELDIPVSETTRHIRFLASDELLGRMTGEQGNHAAARYIAEHFREYGLNYLPGHDDYFQPLPLYRNIVHSGAFITFQNDTLYQRQHFVPLSGKKGSYSAEMVYFESLIDSDGKLLADLNDVVFTDKIIVTEFGGPTDGAGLQALLRFSAQKRAVAKSLGAVAVIERFSGPFQFGVLANFASQSRFNRGSMDDEVVLDHFVVDATVLQVPTSNSKTLNITSAGVTYSNVIADNVVGIVEGSDPLLKNEYILLMAHFDHIGAGMRPGITPADTIFNGARDNGMGVVGLLAAAKGLSANPPKRSVIILAVNAEESGMHGSIHFVNSAPVLLSKIKLVMNVDSGGYNDTSLITLVGHGRTTADPIISDAVQRIGLTLLPDPSPEQNLFNRSDNVHFARAGIPAPTFSPGFTAFDDELLKFYHRPSDQADDLFDFDYLNNFARAYAYTTRQLANTDKPLKWSAGDVYEEAYNKLHGISVE